MAWLFIITTGMFETSFAVFLKMSHGLMKLWPSADFAICVLISFVLLTLALHHLDVGIGLNLPGRG
jgi:quaternary ammonium compound-resistance protein SugE